eukprot:CAMPEP_0116134606 /NCGR_PEP_ID=MMETSP0329-20121206/10738_1 /TAXON_ID=697910 /ORGANISM="Pseudo-nitzschia arenysensis, Strain B593" /LENGTH=30 /DNA_ID= /DNA_START= /DNA_END= /DNA_ORIENTATION=
MPGNVLHRKNDGHHCIGGHETALDEGEKQG